MSNEDLLSYIEMNGGVINANKIPYLQTPNTFLRNPEYEVNEKLVYQVLGTYAGSIGNCFPSKTTIATDLNLGVKTVYRILKSMEAKGMILIINRKWDTKGKTSNMYILADIDWQTGKHSPESLNMYRDLIGEILVVKSTKKIKKKDKE